MNLRRSWSASSGPDPAVQAAAGRDRRPGRAGSWRALSACWCAAIALSTSPPALASPVSYAFTGIFDVSNSSSNVYTDKTFAGSFTYDPAIAPREQSQPGAARYDALMAFELEVQGVAPEFALRVGLAPGVPTAEIAIEEAANGAPSDAFRLFVSSGPRSFLESPFPYESFFLIFELARVSGSIFDDALSLPSTLNLADFDSSNVELRLTAGGDSFLTVNGRITSLEPTATPPLETPEPGTLSLLAIAAGAFAWAARGRRNASTVSRRPSAGSDGPRLGAGLLPSA
jgi:hypothetical protein